MSRFGSFFLAAVWFFGASQVCRLAEHLGSFEPVYVYFALSISGIIYFLSRWVVKHDAKELS